MISYAIMIFLLLNIDTLNSTMDSTLESIVEAERAGVDTTDLVNRFNEVLNMSDCQECIDTIKQRLAEIENDAKVLKNNAIERDKLNTILAYTVYAPIAAFIVALASLYVYDMMQAYKVQRLNMKVRKKDE